jgi:hypothetical protein
MQLPNRMDAPCDGSPGLKKHKLAQDTEITTRTERYQYPEQWALLVRYAKTTDTDGLYIGDGNVNDLLHLLTILPGIC